VNEEVLIGQCLNGERERDCDYCPAHSARRGNCCFGLRHEHGDPDCLACVLEKDCDPLTHRVAKSDVRPTPRIIYPGRAPAKTPVRVAVAPGTMVQSGQSRLPVMQDYGPQPGQPLLIQQPIHPEPLQLNPNDGLFKRFLKVSSWGAGEGFFEMGLNFFRRRRPE
jgi:hypothetical protein